MSHGPDLIVRKDWIYVDLTVPGSPERLRAVFMRIAAAWGLRAHEASRLLGLSEAEYALWLEAPVLTPAIVLRLSYVLGIYADLTRLLPAPGRAARWMRQPNAAPLFGGATALEYMLERDVKQWAAVRTYLSGQLG